MRTAMVLLLVACGGGGDEAEPAGATGTTAPELPEVIVDGETGDPKLKSANSIAFAPAGHIVVGDGAKDRLVVIATGDVTWDAAAADFGRIANLAKQAARALDVDELDVEVRDIAVNPLSGRTYVAVDRMDTEAGHLLTVEADGSLLEVDLSAAVHAVVPYEERDGAGSFVTDLVWAGDVVVAAVNEAAWTSSQVVTFATPVAHRDATAVASTNTYHRVHQAWETFAPITTLFGYTDADGEGWVGASYQCAPVVRFPVSDLLGGGEVTGTTPFDYGGGRQVLDFAVLGEGDDMEVYATVFNLGGTKVSQKLFFEKQAVDEAAEVVFDFGGSAVHRQADAARKLDDMERIAALGDDRIVTWNGSALAIVDRP